MYKKEKGKEKGFTLIELLVVIAIIAILSTVVMAGLNSARLKGRDAKRLSDIKQLQAALELFYDSCQGYPVSGAMPTIATACPGGGAANFGVFMATIPVNPTPGGATYTYTGTASTYTVGFSLEGPSGSLASGAHTASPSGII